MWNFWDSEVWSFILILGVLGSAVLLAGILKNKIGFLKRSLLPSSVLGGFILLIISTVVFYATGGRDGGKYLFELDIFSSASMDGMSVLEILTYHCLGLGFVAMALRQTGKKVTGKRATEVLDSGVTTVSGYLLQGFLGLAVTVVAAWLGSSIWNGAGLLLPFGYGQGTGQAMNYGSMYGSEDYLWGFATPTDGRSFGLAVAALGFLSACIGGVVYMNVHRKRGEIKMSSEVKENFTLEQVLGVDEIPVSGSVDKMTIQIAIVLIVYAASYAVMRLICDAFNLGAGLKATIFGFNFLLGTLMAIGLKGIINGAQKKKLFRRKFINNFMMNRIGGFFFDFMIVAGIVAIRVDTVIENWALLLVLGAVGAVATYAYIDFVTKRVFGEYAPQQFLAWYGMLTGTASTGIILLREIDNDFSTPAADNLVYQNLPAIVLGFPMMFLGTYNYTGAPVSVYVCLFACLILFVALQFFLFRKSIFKPKIPKQDSPSVDAT